MIHLRVRTEFSFRETFAPLAAVTARLKELGCTAAGCVDANASTWGHVRWEAEMHSAGIAPLFGVEVGVCADPAAANAQPLTTWFLAKDPAAMYQLTTLAHTQAVSGKACLSRRQFLDAQGIIRFTGNALLDDPEAVEAGCWVDLNPGSLLATRQALSFLRRNPRARAVVTADNAYAAPQDKPLFGLAARMGKPTPQHLLQAEEYPVAMGGAVSGALIEAAHAHAAEIAAELAGVRLARAPLIKLAGDVEALCREGIKTRLQKGQIAAWTPEYEQRLVRELELVREKAFESYFLMVADMVVWAKERMLVGPARGSAAGSLACYLMQITEVDPMPYGLMFERFVDITRKDLPDIDLDFPDSKREQVYEYLRAKYGEPQVARIGTISEYKPRSALAEVAKRLGVPPWETSAVKDAMFVRSSGDSRANNCLADTLADTEPGRALLARFPAIRLAGELEGHASHSGVHAAGVIVCNQPISHFCTVADGVAQLDKGDAEKLNLLKIDVLGLRTLSVIEDCGMLSTEQIYALPFDDPQVFKLLNEGRFSGVFQWEGQALQSLTKQITMRSLDDMTHITALARPGPLGGGAASKFIARHSGREPVEVAHPSMLPYLAESFGLVLYQEQVIRICREIGGLSWEDNTALRKAMSKSYGKEFFDQYAARFVTGAASFGLKASEALDVWDQVNSMGSWSFNKSHAVSYAMVSYWTAWLKAHHPLQYAAAALRNAKDDESALITLREICAEGVDYVPFDLELSQLNWSVQDGKLVGGLLQMKGIGAATAQKVLDARAKGDIDAKLKAKLDKATLIFKDLYPAHTMWRDYYTNPERMGLQRGSVVVNIADFPEEGPVVFIGQLKQKDSRDYNEAVRLAKRNGKRMRDPTLFLDLRVTDDSTLTPLLCRVDRYEYEPTGRLLLERAGEDRDWFLIRGNKLRNFPMVQVEKIRCLNNPALLKETTR